MRPWLRKTSTLYTDAYKGHRKEIWVLTLTTLINRAGTMVVPFLTVYLTTVLDFSLKEGGLVISAFGLGALGGTYIAGRLSDKIDPKWIIIGSLAVSGCFYISLQSAQTLPQFMALIFMAGLMGEGYRPAMMVTVARMVPKSETGRTTALLRLAVNIGMSIGPAVGGFVAVALDYNWLFWMDGLTCIFGAVFFVIVSWNWPSLTPKKDAQKAELKPVKAVSPLKNKAYLKFLIATFLMGFAFIQWFHTVPVFIKGDWGFDERYIGILLGISSVLIIIFEMPMIHSIEKAKRNRNAVLIGLILLALSFAPFFFSKMLALCVIAMLFFTFGEILALPLNTSTALNMSPERRRGDYQSWYWMAWSMTNIIGPLFGLFVAEHFGFLTFWVILFGMLGLSFLLNLNLENSASDENEANS